jgi:hypothetical protein
MNKISHSCKGLYVVLQRGGVVVSFLLSNELMSNGLSILETHVSTLQTIAKAKAFTGTGKLRLDCLRRSFFTQIQPNIKFFYIAPSKHLKLNYYQLIDYLPSEASL